MHSVKILHCADVHIGATESFLGHGATARRFETLLTFERIIAAARQNNTQIILIAGDLFDSNSVEQTFVDRVFSAVTSVPEIKVVVACGNHDPLCADSPFKKTVLPENLFVMGEDDGFVTFDDLKTRVYGRSFTQTHMQGKPRFSLLVPNDDFINLMVLHGELSSDLNSDYNAITQNFISQSGMDYIALGHIHKRTGVGRIGDTYCAYCGCPEGQGFDETDQKGVYIGAVSKGAVNLEFLPVSKRLHITEKIELSDSVTCDSAVQTVLDCLLSNYGENYGENLYKIVLTGEIDENCDINTAEITGRLAEKLYFVKVKNETEIKPDFEALANEKTLKGIFVKRMCEKIDAAAEDEKPQLRRALTLGLRAFKGEFDINED